jgi:hypothetical protein
MQRYGIWDIVKKAWNAKFLYQCALMNREEQGLMYAANAHGNRCVGSSPKIPVDTHGYHDAL